MKMRTVCLNRVCRIYKYSGGREYFRPDKKYCPYCDKKLKKESSRSLLVSNWIKITRKPRNNF